MPSNAIPGHGASVAMELNPSGAQGTFTVIGEMQDIQRPEMSRAETESTTHQDGIDYWVIAPVIRRGLLSGTVNYVNGDGTLDHLTGLQYALLNAEERGFQILGPGGSAGVHEWIGSGEVQLFGPVTYPVREGLAQAPFAIRLSGPMYIDGVLFS